MHLGGDDDLVALGEILERPPQNLLARAVGIHIGGVEEVDAELERLLDEGAALLLAKRPAVIAALGRAIAHAAEAKA
jgi:hypothetical protein